MTIPNALRVACVTLPHLSVAVAERDAPELVGRPFAIAREDRGAVRIDDASYRAFLAGVAPGMTVGDARRLCPDLTVLPPPAAARGAAFQALMETLAGLTPAVEPADFDRAWFACDGLADGFGEERSLAAYVAVSVRAATGVPARVGLAHGKVTARIVTDYLHQRDTMVLPSGYEVPFLGGLATRYLPLGGDAIQHLHRRGIRTIRQFAARPRDEVRALFGPAGVRAHALAVGRDDARVAPWAAELPIQAGYAFAAPVQSRRSLAFRATRLAYAVHPPLQARYRIAGRMTLTLTDPEGARIIHCREILAPVPGASDLAEWAEGLVNDAGGGVPVARLTLAVGGLCVAPRWQLAQYARSLDDEAGPHGSESCAIDAIPVYNVQRRIDPIARIAT